MDRAPFNRLSMATDLTKDGVCAKCGEALCEHSDIEWLGTRDPESADHRQRPSHSTGEPRE